MTFQAGLTVIEVHFKAEEEDDDPEPLRMEHFFFPLGLWLVGLILSAIFLLAEIIIHRLRKSQSIANLEEPSVSQSTSESENMEEMVLNTEGAELDLAGSEDIEDMKDTKVEV